MPNRRGLRRFLVEKRARRFTTTIAVSTRTPRPLSRENNSSPNPRRQSCTPTPCRLLPSFPRLMPLPAPSPKVVGRRCVLLAYDRSSALPCRIILSCTGRRGSARPNRLDRAGKKVSCVIREDDTTVGTHFEGGVGREGSYLCPIDHPSQGEKTVDATWGAG